MFATSLGHSIRIIDPSRILLPNGQVHITIFFMKYVQVNFQDWKPTQIFKFGQKTPMMTFYACNGWTQWMHEWHVNMD
jgi:hypothetical protein